MTHFVALLDDKLLQFYVHRHEWAMLMIEAHKKGVVTRTLSNGFVAQVNQRSNKAIIMILDKELVFSLKNSALGKQLSKDVELLLSIISESNTPEFSALLRKSSREFGGDNFYKLLSVVDRQLMFFELMHLYPIKTQLDAYGIFLLYPQKVSEDVPFDSFTHEAKWIVENDSCNCGDEACFFPILKRTFLLNFKSKEPFVANGIYRQEEMKQAFNAYWAGLSFNHRAVLLHLNSHFTNQILLNMYMLDPEFELKEFERVMCRPYRPGSKEDVLVRTISAQACYYLYLNRLAQ